MSSTVEVRKIPPEISPRQWGGLIGAPLILIALWFAPIHEVAAAQHALAISTFMIVLWATEAVDYGLTSFLGVFLFWALGVAEFERAFSGFSNETPWFLFGAVLIGMMASKSGLTRRIANTILTRGGTSYSRLLLTFIVVDFVLTPLVPSDIARVAILAPIVAGTVDVLGLDKRNNVSRGLLIIVTYAASIFDKMTSFITYLPAIILTILCCWRLILWLYPPEKGDLKVALEGIGPWSPAEKKCAVLTGLAVALWMTGFLHHINPTPVALSIGLLALAPTIGTLNVEDLRKFNWGVIWFSAAALSMSRILTDTKAIEFLTGVPGMIWTFAAGARIFAYQGAPLILGYSYGFFDAKDLLKVGLIMTALESVILLLLVSLYWPLIGIS